jgi:hypothetical protein
MQASRVSEDPIAVLRIIQVMREGAEASLNAICWLDKEVRELSEFHPNEDRIGQMESVVQMFEKEILEWERTRTVRPDSAPEAGSDPGQEQGRTWQELVEMLEEILAEADAAEDLELGPVDNEWAQQVLQQATKVSCMAREICDNSAKAGWQPCTYSEYRWLMGQEIRYLYACFSCLEKEEAPVCTQRRAKTWLAGAHEDAEWARTT